MLVCWKYDRKIRNVNYYSKGSPLFGVSFQGSLDLCCDLGHLDHGDFGALQDLGNIHGNATSLGHGAHLLVHIQCQCHIALLDLFFQVCGVDNHAFTKWFDEMEDHD